MSRTLNLICKDDWVFPSRKEVKWMISIVDLSDEEVIHKMPLARLLMVSLRYGNCENVSSTSAATMPRVIGRVPTVHKGNQVGFLVLLAVNFCHDPYKLVDGNGITMPSSLQTTKVFTFEAAHLSTFNDDSYSLWEPTGNSPELLTIWAFIQTSVEH